MTPTTHPTTDPVEEFVLRRWAREHHVPSAQRDGKWHPVVLDEMRRKDTELAEAVHLASVGRRIVPLVPAADHALHGPHIDFPHPTVLLQVPALAETYE